MRRTLGLRFPLLNPRGDITWNESGHVLNCSELINTFWILLLMGVNFSHFGSCEICDFYLYEWFCPVG